MNGWTAVTSSTPTGPTLSPITPVEKTASRCTQTAYAIFCDFRDGSRTHSTTLTPPPGFLFESSVNFLFHKAEGFLLVCQTITFSKKKKLNTFEVGKLLPAFAGKPFFWENNFPHLKQGNVLTSFGLNENILLNRDYFSILVFLFILENNNE